MKWLLSIAVVLAILNVTIAFLAWWDLNTVNSNLWLMWNSCATPVEGQDT